MPNFSSLAGLETNFSGGRVDGWMAGESGIKANPSLSLS